MTSKVLGWLKSVEFDLKNVQSDVKSVHLDLRSVQFDVKILQNVFKDMTIRFQWSQTYHPSTLGIFLGVFQNTVKRRFFVASYGKSAPCVRIEAGLLEQNTFSPSCSVVQ